MGFRGSSCISLEPSLVVSVALRVDAASRHTVHAQAAPGYSRLG